MDQIKLADIDTKPPDDLTENGVDNQFDNWKKKIDDFQKVMYAQKKYSLLIVLQGMDAAGKDSAVNKVFSKVGHAGLRVQAFKKPTDLEMSHDFLWRVHHHVPQKGMIQVFNRSHYEDVLIQRVHNWIDNDTVHKRFEHINNFEKLLSDSGTVVLKFYLHISKDQQLKELNERLEDPEKYYKHNPNDFKERERWDEYMRAYEDVFRHCGPQNPWHIIPADENWYKEYCMARIIVDACNKLELSYPPLPE